MNKATTLILAGLVLATVTGCAPEVGSPKWCEAMKEKPREKWTLEEIGDFAKHCIFPANSNPENE